MNEELIEVREYSGPGYQPVIDFQTWRVAILNYIDEIHPAKINFMERHNETAEVFVLIKGKGILFLGRGTGQVWKKYIHKCSNLERYIMLKKASGILSF